MRIGLPYLLYLFLLLSCSGKISVTGKYASKSSPYGFYVNKDSTFGYKFYQFHAYEYSSGKWQRVSRRRIVLNSFYRNTTIPLEVLELRTSNDRLNRLSFQFTSAQIDAKDCECAIFINDSLKVIGRCDAMTFIETEQPLQGVFVEVRKSPLLMTTLRFSLDPLITNVYSTSKKYGNDIKFNIVVNDSLFSYRVFDNSIIKVKKRGIYFYDQKREKKYWIPKLEK